MISTVSSVSSEEVPSINPEASFSFSDDDEDISVDRREINTNPNTSFRLKIRKGIPENKSLGQNETNAFMDNTNAFVRTNYSFPETQKERTKSQMKNREKTPHFHRGSYYDKKSWRAKNVPGDSKALNANHQSFKDEREPSYFESLLSMCNYFLSPQAVDDREIKPSTSSFEGVRESFEEERKVEMISDKEYRSRFQSCLNAVKSQKWDIVINEIETLPPLISFQDSKHESKNLIHVIAGNNSSIPSDLLRLLITENDALQQVDKNGCVPLHYAVSIGRNEELVKTLLSQWEEGAIMQNKDGDSPLHVAVWNGIGNDTIVKHLIEANPNALGVRNNEGGFPLHLSCYGKLASPSIVEMLLRQHEEFDFPVDDLDSNGNSALHVAVKTKASLQVLESFMRVCGDHVFYQHDENGSDAFQIAFTSEVSDNETIHFLAKGAPRSIKKMLPNGTMPVIYAAKRGMPDTIMKLLVLADMPLYFRGKNQNEIRDVFLRTHGYSWWKICTNHPEYTGVISDILKNEANINEIVALSQETNPNGFGNLFESSNVNVRDAFKRNLVFGERYEILTNYRVVTSEGLMKMCALDWAERIAWEEFAGKGSVQPSNAGDALVENEISEASKAGKAFDFSSPHREVILYCCLKNKRTKWYKELIQEMEARRQFNFSVLFSQRLYNVHIFDAKSLGCNGDLLCLSFEKPLLTLQDVFDTSRFRKRKNAQWVRKSWNLLNRLAKVLQYFHSSGYVHGSVEPSTIAKFVGSNNWKLLDMRKATRIGESMSGGLRMGAPPESVIGCDLDLSASQDQIKSVSFDGIFNKTKEVNYDTGMEYDGPIPEFAPEEVCAHPTWDIFSFGLIMAQLLLGQSMVLLPNFERPEDAHLKRLYNYDMAALEKIVAAARKTSGHLAAELLEKCLQPFPENRPQSMESIINDPFFQVETE